MKKINLLIITIRADVGGGPRHVDLLINNLSTEFSVFLSCPKDKPYYHLWINNSKVNGISTIPHRKFSLISFLKLVRFCKKHKIDVINSNGKGAGLYSRLLKIFFPNIRIIHTFNGVNIKNYKSLKTQLYFMYERFLSRFTDEYINVSNGEKEVCLKERFFEDNKSTVIYNCTSKFNNAIVPDSLLHLKDKFVIITLSRFDYQKNMQESLQIAKSLKDIIFLFVGDGPDKNELEEQAKNEKIENVIFTGFKNNVEDYFTVSDLYLSTARWEGLPFALVEALSSGIPIVASDVTGNNEVVINEHNGYLYSLGDYQSAVEKIINLYNDETLLEKLSDNAYQTFKTKFDLDIMLQKTQQLIKKTYITKQKNSSVPVINEFN